MVQNDIRKSFMNMDSNQRSIPETISALNYLKNEREIQQSHCSVIMLNADIFT